MRSGGGTVAFGRNNSSEECPGGTWQLVRIRGLMSTIPGESQRRYTVIRNCMPNARVMRMTVAKLGLPFSDSAL